MRKGRVPDLTSQQRETTDGKVGQDWACMSARGWARACLKY